jgi:protein ImuB
MRVLVLRCPDLLADEMPDEMPEGSARAFEPVVALVEEFCPHVEVLRPGVCAMPARGPARYFGGETELADRVAAAVGRAGYGCQVGVADGLFAAGLAARTGSGVLVVPPGKTPEFLTRFPVGVLGMPELCELLPRLGIETLGQLARLPPAEAVSRFGPPGGLAGRLARGLDPRPLIPRPPAVDLSAAMEFDPPAGQAEPVIFAAKALADQMHDRLRADGFGCVRVRVEVHYSGGAQVSRLWRHDGLLSALAVAERVRWQLDGRSASQSDDPAPGGAVPGGAVPGGAVPGGAVPGGDDGELCGVTLLRLVPDQLVRATGRQLALWGDAVVSDRVARAAIRVQAMLGHERVTRPVAAGGRRPVEQVLLVPFGDAGVPQRAADRPWPGRIPAPSPATVYPAPPPASVTDSAGEAVSVGGRARLSAAPARLSVDGGPARLVTAWAGPWPVTQRWWDPPKACRQARFQLVTDDGHAWLAALQDGRWQIEARYD